MCGKLTLRRDQKQIQNNQKAKVDVKLTGQDSGLSLYDWFLLPLAYLSLRLSLQICIWKGHLEAKNTKKKVERTWKNDQY